LTTIRQDAQAMVNATVRALMVEIDGGTADMPDPLPVTLIRRNSA
jgi:DNA-binding LacI/PurR family transcriptional regulator